MSIWSGILIQFCCDYLTSEHIMIIIIIFKYYFSNVGQSLFSSFLTSVWYQHTPLSCAPPWSSSQCFLWWFCEARFKSRLGQSVCTSPSASCSLLVWMINGCLRNLRKVNCGSARLHISLCLRKNIPTHHRQAQRASVTLMSTTAMHGHARIPALPSLC